MRFVPDALLSLYTSLTLPPVPLWNNKNCLISLFSSSCGIHEDTSLPLESHKNTHILLEDKSHQGVRFSEVPNHILLFVSVLVTPVQQLI